MKLYPVILSGGSGTRLWPLSREQYPKQLLRLLGSNTMLQDTATRVQGIPEIQTPLIVCNEEHRFLVAEQLRQAGIVPRSILLESVGRNTAPALTLAALMLRESEPDALMLVMPADHVIRDEQLFAAAVAKAASLAEQGRIVTFGIVPTSPETGYGYIQRGADDNVAAFVEKPNLETARTYVASGDFFWNSGMFVVKASVWLEEVGGFNRAILEHCEAALRGKEEDLDFVRLDADAFARCPADSIDYAVMEKTDKAAMVPLDAGWSDVGAWSSLWEVGEKDSAENVTQGDVCLHETQGSLIIGQHRMVAVVGVSDLVVVETPDAVLVTSREKAQDVKEVTAWLRNEGRDLHQVHRRVFRPWGYYEGVDAGDRFQVKRIAVNPGASLSLQMHHHRAEHWIVVKGTARVTRGDEELLLSENQSTYIPIGMKHRLENPGTVPLEIIEVQSGSYLGEDDIVRYEDIYNRK